MSYYVADVSGWLGDLATTTGLHELYKVLTASKEPELVVLASKGATDNPAAVVTEASKLLRGNLDPNVRKTIVELVRLARKAKEIIIISDGVGEETKKKGK